MRSETYQILLIISGVVVSALFGAFLYREMFPEYKLYQNDYIALEQFRSTYTHQPPPPFQTGVKQVVIEREDKGPAIVDRCTSCHVALQIPYFSPTKIAYDLNGNIVKDEKGHPLLIPNEEYIWLKLDEKIAELRDEKVLEQLENQGETGEVQQRLKEAKKYEDLKIVHVGDRVYDVEKVLAMHPLMGNEIYPFQYHPVEEYGCISCHNGNGRGLVSDKAHGPVFDEKYDIEELGHVPQFIEKDPKNDPKFASVFNHQPGSQLIFQTEPIYVGSLIQAKCVQCHQTSDIKIANAENEINGLLLYREQQIKSLAAAYENERQALSDLLNLQQMIQENGFKNTLQQLQTMASDYSLPSIQLEHISSQLKYLTYASNGMIDEKQSQKLLLERLNQDLLRLLGSDALVKEIKESYQTKGKEGIDPFLKSHQGDPRANGILFAKGEALDRNQDLMQHAQESSKSFSGAVKDQKLIKAVASDVDELTRNYQRGKDLYLSQACYACHRITGFARGGVGPELTKAGDLYPWYMKRKLSWPQGDLHNSTMPNMRFDPKEIEDLMTFLLGQKGGNRAVSKTGYQSTAQAWEAGQKMEWEKPITPSQIYDLRYSMTVFATQGCAACHRLQGFESNIGFAIEKKNPSFDQLYQEQQWFRKLFPEVVHFSYYDEELPGSEIVTTIDEHSSEIDLRIVDHVRTNGILEEIDASHPEVLESLYSTFRYASRAKNDHYQSLIDQEKDPVKISQIKIEWKNWKERVHRLLMMYIQTYGLGRLIGPHLNWSGIYRSDEWLMEHFRNPTSHVPRSIMPVFPFDDTKFFALTHMLDVLALRNRHAIRQIWEERGFDPEEAFNMLCAQCHGIGRVGNGVISEWIYPIPKNLRNQDFLRNLTQDKVIDSIHHGVKGTPMPGWGEVASDKPSNLEKAIDRVPVLKEGEIRHLVDWIFTALPGGEVIKHSTDVPKWQYTPDDVLKDLRNEGGQLKGFPEKEESKESPLSYLLKMKKIYFASLTPVIVPANGSKNQDIEDIFDVVSNPTDTREKDYYIKKKYYTPYNIQQGQAFFLINCAVCHGNEADGSGTRSQAMQEAKPRMLINLDWINSRDDLRLLRSIKYGVPGTSMTPWGDLTSSLQRLQLVIFIRSLTQEQEKRTQLFQALYQTFEPGQSAIESARIEGSKKIENLQASLTQAREKQAEAEKQISREEIKSQEALTVYQQTLDLESQLREIKQQDQKLAELKTNLKKQRELYFNIGMSLINKNISDSILQTYFSLIRLNSNRYTFDDHKLVDHQNEETKESIRKLSKQIVDQLNQKIGELEAKQQVIQGKISSAQQREELNANSAEIDAYKKIKGKLITDIEEALRITPTK